MQHSLFDIDDEGLSISGIASDLGTSEASVRNWIKAGYLVLDDRKLVTRESLRNFKNKVVGVEKLVGRANKKFLPPLFGAKAFDRNDFRTEELSRAYENSLSAAFKNQEGIFYTPDSVADDFFSRLPDARENLIFCDPCCGSGQFLVSAIRNGFLPANVYGYDTDANAVAIARQRLSQFPDFLGSNIVVQDFLQCTSTPDEFGPRFDVIMTNPPWGKKLPKLARETMGKALNAGKSVDTCSLFFLSAIRHLRPDGYCGFLLPESFFNIAAFEDARRHVLNLQILTVVDYGKAFPQLLTKAVGIVVQKASRQLTPITTVCRSVVTHNSHLRETAQFLDNPNAIINFRSNADEAATLSHIMKLPHQTLKGRARWGLGIVTGNNSRFIRNTAAPGYVPIWRGSDITADGLKSPSIYIPDDFSLYQQVAPIELYASPEKLIYKFISDRLFFFHDTEQRFVLNSVNLVVPESSLKISQAYLEKYFNSKVINWIFQSVFGTHKILRGDIEKIPLFAEFIARSDRFDEAALCDYLGIRGIEGGTYRIA
jgi:site-specific DNA-methyltransferase (adenine-specific)